MAKTNKNNKNHIKQYGNGFLKDEVHKKELAQEHKEYLGMDIPDNYFSNSKESILNSLPSENEQKRTVFGLKPYIAYPLAASFLILVGIFVWLQNDTPELNPKITNTEVIQSLTADSDDFLVPSLLIEDDKLEVFLDDFIVNEILVEAELSEQQLENIFINSLFVEDSLINNYIDKTLLENIVL
ncbi:MAG: hypothetical protein KJO52_07225 [Maribacter sp.]|nr:hypothetical protein [Maribacter sp.]MBT8302479.1 hypothetical protein [Maribacter sp.]